MDWRSQRYGRITGAEIEQWLEILNEVWAERESWKELAEDDEKIGAFVGKLVQVPNWINFYNDTLVELIAKIAIAAGLSDKLIAGATSAEPTVEILNLIDELPDEAPEHPAAMPLAFAMIGNLDAIATYSRSIALTSAR